MLSSRNHVAGSHPGGRYPLGHRQKEILVLLRDPQARVIPTRSGRGYRTVRPTLQIGTLPPDCVNSLLRRGLITYLWRVQRLTLTPEGVSVCARLQA